MRVKHSDACNEAFARRKRALNMAEFNSAANAGEKAMKKCPACKNNLRRNA